MTGRWLGAFLLLTVALVASAQKPVDEALETVTETNRADAATQNRIDDISAETLEMLNEYRRAVTRRQQLKVYNRELEKIIAEQERRKAALKQQMATIQDLRAEIEPLMLRMIDHLEQFVEADLPFLMRERKQRIASLRAAVANPDLSVAERFRKVLAAYQAEAKYGRTIGTYRGELEINGQQRFVEFLRMGRVMLLYITPDNSRVGYWNREQEAWQPLPDHDAEAIRQGVRLAKDLAASQLLALPVPAPDSIGAGSSAGPQGRATKPASGNSNQSTSAKGGGAS